MYIYILLFFLILFTIFHKEGFTDTSSIQEDDWRQRYQTSLYENNNLQAKIMELEMNLKNANSTCDQSMTDQSVFFTSKLDSMKQLLNSIQASYKNQVDLFGKRYNDFADTLNKSLQDTNQHIS